jgi:hypothetical protein
MDRMKCGDCYRRERVCRTRRQMMKLARCLAQVRRKLLRTGGFANHPLANLAILADPPAPDIPRLK